jgi:predicted Zn-dependent protease with MMP-like domain
VDYSAAVDSNNYRGKLAVAQNRTRVTVDTAHFAPHPGPLTSSNGRRKSGRRLGRVLRMAYEMTDDEFDLVAERALDEIPEALLAMMENVAIFIEDAYKPLPGEDPATKLLGLYEGTSLTERDSGWGAGSMPDRITIFKNAILEICSTEKQVVEEVGITIVHEIAHHFGIDDERLHELGWG